MRPYHFWLLFVVILLQGLTIRKLKNELDGYCNKTLDNAVQIVELRKDLDQTIYAIGTK